LSLKTEVTICEQGLSKIRIKDEELKLWSRHNGVSIEIVQ